MSEPVLHDKRQEHSRFYQFAYELIERVSGKRQNNNIPVTLDKIRRVRYSFPFFAISK